MQAELANVRETERVANLPVNREELDEAVLRSTQVVLNLVATTTKFALLIKLVVHALEGSFVESGVLGPHDE